MTLTFGKILKPFFKISATTFRDLAADRYGQQADLDVAWQSFEPVARTLVDGFHMALEEGQIEGLVLRLNAVEQELRGIAYEGAGMGLMLLDSLAPWKKRLQAFVDGPGAPYKGLVYIGAGLVMPRVPRRPARVLASLDPLWCWLAIDGYGFYEGFFSWHRCVEMQTIPKRLSGYALRAFDQGLGRSFWFSTGANADRIGTIIATFPPARQADLWSGIGLACAYAAGVVDRTGIETLQKLASSYSSHLAVGAAIAAQIRQQTGHPAPHTELACEILWGMSSDMVAHIAEVAFRNLPVESEEPAYEIWRQRIEAQFITRIESASTQEEISHDSFRKHS